MKPIGLTLPASTISWSVVWQIICDLPGDFAQSIRNGHPAMLYLLKLALWGIFLLIVFGVIAKRNTPK